MRIFYRGALIAPFSAPLCFYIGSVVYLFAIGRLGNDLSEIFIEAPILIFGWGLIIGYPAMFLLGLPYVYWLYFKDKLSTKYVCGGAVFLGGVISIIFTVIIGIDLTFLLMMIFPFLSLITSYVFCRLEGITSCCIGKTTR